MPKHEPRLLEDETGRPVYAGDPWDLQPNEPAEAFRLFRHYIEQGVRRSLKVTAAYRAQLDVSQIAGTSRQMRAIEKLSRLWHWRARVGEWEREQARLFDAELRDKRKAMMLRHEQLSRVLQGKVVERLQTFTSAELTPKLMMDALDLSVKVERLSLLETADGTGELTGAGSRWKADDPFPTVPLVIVRRESGSREA